MEELLSYSNGALTRGKLERATQCLCRLNFKSLRWMTQDEASRLAYIASQTSTYELQARALKLAGILFSFSDSNVPLQTILRFDTEEMYEFLAIMLRHSPSFHQPVQTLIRSLYAAHAGELLDKSCSTLLTRYMTRMGATFTSIFHSGHMDSLQIHYNFELLKFCQTNEASIVVLMANYDFFYRLCRDSFCDWCHTAIDRITYSCLSFLNARIWPSMNVEVFADVGIHIAARMTHFTTVELNETLKTFVVHTLMTAQVASSMIKRICMHSPDHTIRRLWCPQYDYDIALITCAARTGERAALISFFGEQTLSYMNRRTLHSIRHSNTRRIKQEAKRIMRNYVYHCKRISSSEEMVNIMCGPVADAQALCRARLLWEDKIMKHISDPLICPITLQPVLIPMEDTTSGHIYECDAIMAWVYRKHSSPLTRKQLFLTDLKLRLNRVMHNEGSTG